MWNRKDLKAHAKVAFKANYWKCVLVSVIITLLTGAGASGISSNSSSGTGSIDGAVNEIQDAIANEPEAFFIVLAIILGIVAIALVISAVIEILVKNPLLIGTSTFFVDNSTEPAKLGSLTKGFKKGAYLKNVWAMFLKDLFLALGYAVLVIPGIILTYAFRLVPYILADNPDMKAMDAIKESVGLMKGNKWKAFVLDLSFIGWDLLSACTAGILGVFYVAPYKNQTDAELYKALAGK